MSNYLKIAILFLCIISLTICAGCVTEQKTLVNTAEPADMIIYGTIYTVDKNNTVAEAVAVKNGKIIYVGNKSGAEKYNGTKTEIIKGPFILPGFISGHEHGISGLIPVLYQINLHKSHDQVDEFLNYVKEYIDTESQKDANVLLNKNMSVLKKELVFADYLYTIEQYVTDHPELKEIVGMGWDDAYLVPGAEYAHELDAICADKPVVLVSFDGHSTWVNSKTLELLGYTKDTPDPVGGKIDRDSQGNPNGLLRDSAAARSEELVCKPTPEQIKTSTLLLQKYLLRNGVTAHMDAGINIMNQTIADVLIDMSRNGELLGKIYASWAVKPGTPDVDSVIAKTLELKNQTAGEMFEVKFLKLYADGGITGHTAKLIRDYTDTPGFNGSLSYPVETFNELVLKAKQNNLMVHIHTIGDGALRANLDALENAYTKLGITDGRDSMTHLQLADQNDIQRAGKLHITATINPFWFENSSKAITLERKLVGDQNMDEWYQAKSFADAGCVLSSAADLPVSTTISPLVGIQMGVTRTEDLISGFDPKSESIESYIQKIAKEEKLSSEEETALLTKAKELANEWKNPDGSSKSSVLNPKEALTVEQMIRAYTIGGAYLNADENNRGSIEVGKVADMVILSNDITKVKPDTIVLTTDVLKTIVNGKVLYDIDD